MDNSTLDKIKQAQGDYYNAVKETDIDGNEKKNNVYNQIFKSEKLGYWVDVYDGPEGKGYVIGEEKTENQKDYVKSYHTGPEEYRNKDDKEWVEIKEE